jgi:hypothetical protein
VVFSNLKHFYFFINAVLCISKLDHKTKINFNETSSLGKLYLIPTTMGDCDPMDVLPQTVKEPLISLIIILLRMTKQHENQ